MDREPASDKSFMRCPECLRILPHHNPPCSIYQDARRRLLKMGFAAGAATIAAFLIGRTLPVQATPAPSISSTIEPGSMEKPASYTIYVDGTTYLANNGKTGVNDYSGTDGFAVMQSAHNALSTGGRIYTKGTIVGKTQLAITNTGISIQGEGRGGTILRADPTFPTSTPMILVNADDFTINDLLIDGNNVTGSQGIQTGSITGGHISFGGGANVFWHLSLRNVAVTNCKSNIGAMNIQGYYYADISFCKAYSNVNGIFLGNMANWSLVNCQSHDNQQAALNCQTDEGAIIGGAYYNTTNDHNIIIGPTSLPAMLNINVVGVLSKAAWKSGLQVNLATVMIIGSQFYDNGVIGSGPDGDRAGIQLAGSSNCVIEGCVCTNTGPVTTQRYGLFEKNAAVNASNNTIRDTALNNNNLQAYALVAATSSLRNCLGVNPQGVATISVTASPFTYTNNDNVDENIHIIAGSGGTVSQIAKNSINLLNANLAGMATVLLEPTETVTVTYATATAVMNKDRK